MRPLKADTGAKLTRTSLALTRIREDIVSGRIAPGERLVIATLADAIDSGQTPVREALMRLVSEGLVTLEDQRGFSVAPISRDELAQLKDARAEIETLALRWSIENGDENWEDTVFGAFYRMQRKQKLTPDGGLIDPDWEQRHEQFHSALVSACGNDIVLSMRAMLFQRANRYRRLSVRYRTIARDDVAEHKAIMDAALERDTAKAEALLRAHINQTADVVMDEAMKP